MVIQEIFDIVFVYQRPAKLSTQGAGKRAFPLPAKPFMTINHMGMYLSLWEKAFSPSFLSQVYLR